MSENASKGLAAKLAAVMAAVERIPKRGRNDFHHYDYATEADIVAAIRNELASRNVILLPAITRMEREKVGDKGSIVTHAYMDFTFVDGDSGESIVRSWMGAGADKEDKGLYKAMTGGEKYFLLKTFLIPTGDDPEQDDRQRAAFSRQSPTRPQQRQPAQVAQRSAAKPPTSPAPPPAAVPAAEAVAPPAKAEPTAPPTTELPGPITILSIQQMARGDTAWLEVALSNGQTVIANTPRTMHDATTLLQQGVPIQHYVEKSPKGALILKWIKPAGPLAAAS